MFEYELHITEDIAAQAVVEFANSVTSGVSARLEPIKDEKGDNVIFIRSLGQLSFMAGIMLGYAACLSAVMEGKYNDTTNLKDKS